MNRNYITKGIVLTLMLFLAGSICLAQLITKLPTESEIYSSLPLVAGFVYTFMVGMIAVSAVIFLITPGNNLASLYILAVAEEGFLGMACAISIMLILVVAASLGALKLLSKYTKTEVY